MGIWQSTATIEGLNSMMSSNMVKHLGIEFVEVGEDHLSARMPVDERTKQPMGLLHGGASVVLAETLGSAAGFLCKPEDKSGIVGLEVNANHLRSIKEGFVIGKASPVHLGRRTQVWKIEITEETTGKMVCISRLTIAVLD